MAKPVKQSNGRHWRTQREARADLKAILGRHACGDRFAFPQDQNDLQPLPQRYDVLLPPGSDAKSGAGVSYFSKELNLGIEWASDSFHMCRVDGISNGFSYIDAGVDKVTKECA